MNMESLKAVGASSVHVAVLLGQFCRSGIAQKPVTICGVARAADEVLSKEWEECKGLQELPEEKPEGGGAADLAQTLLILANTSL